MTAIGLPRCKKWEMPALDKLFFAELPAGSRILDLYCGTGHLARELVYRHFSVTGVDNSFGMLEMARLNVPQGADFLLQNATSFELPQPEDAAVCTVDSINRILPTRLVLGFVCANHKSAQAGWQLRFRRQYSCRIWGTPEARGERSGAGSRFLPPRPYLRGHYDAAAPRAHTAPGESQNLSRFCARPDSSPLNTGAPKRTCTWKVITAKAGLT